MKFYVESYDEINNFYFCNIPAGERVEFSFDGKNLSFLAQQDLTVRININYFVTLQGVILSERGSLVGKWIECDYLFDYLSLAMEASIAEEQ